MASWSYKLVFEKFILAKFCKNYNFFNKDYDFIFNSYYQTVGHFNLRKNRGSLSRPTLDEVLRYRSYIDKYLDHLYDINNIELEELIKIALNHEQQHQELILMDIKNILYSNKSKPSYIKKISEIKCSKELKEKNQFILNDFKKIKYGYDGDDFSFDNERPESKDEPSSIYLI